MVANAIKREREREMIVDQHILISGMSCFGILTTFKYILQSMFTILLPKEHSLKQIFAFDIFFSKQSHEYVYILLRVIKPLLLNIYLRIVCMTRSKSAYSDRHKFFHNSYLPTCQLIKAFTFPLDKRN
jgi:hypothetical protein